MPNQDREIDEAVNSSFHQIGTRALRDAPIYLQHVSSAKSDMKQAIQQLIDKARADELKRADRFELSGEYGASIRWQDYAKDRLAELQGSGESE